MALFQKYKTLSIWDFAGLALTPLRLSLGWVIFSAFWRRVVLKPESLDILSPEYEGLKFNHFIASSMEGLSSMILWLIEHPSLLYVFLWVFTLVEGCIGLMLILGFLTRAASFIGFFLLLGIMWGAGWLGTTCVDEWTIGVLGISACLALFFGGAGPYSFDGALLRRNYFQHGFWHAASSGPLFREESAKSSFRWVFSFSVFAFALALITNQINVHGVLGPFENPAVKPSVKLTPLSLNREGFLRLRLFRDKGPDTYGAFIVEGHVYDSERKEVLGYDTNYLAHLSPEDIHNYYLVKIKPDAYSLIVPLAAMADINFQPPSKGQNLSPGTYTIELIDVSGAAWKASIEIER